MVRWKKSLENGLTAALLTLALCWGSVVTAQNNIQGNQNGGGNQNAGNNQTSTPQQRPARAEQGNRRNTQNNQQGNQQDQQNNKEAPAKDGQPPASERPRRAQPAAAAPKAPSGPSLGEYSVVVNSDARLLRLHLAGKPDRQDEKVSISTEIVTEVTLENRDLQPFDAIRVLLSFDSEYLEPLAINDSALAANIDGEPTAEVDPVLGTVLYEARLATPVVSSDRPLLSIRWKPRKTVLGTSIEFSKFDNLSTLLTYEGTDIIGNPRDATDGTLSMRLSILPDDVREAEAMLSDPTIFMGGGGKVGGVRLFLKPQEEPIVEGETFHVDVILDNRAFSNVDGVSLLVSFQPDAIQIVDADYDNYITREMNIHDGPFQKQFPWTFHIDNVVYQSRGMIHYKVGTGDADMTRGKVGPIARIYAVARRPTAGTPMTFRFTRELRDRGTAVTYNGQDCLGDSSQFADGSTGTVLKILPRGIEIAAPQATDASATP